METKEKKQNESWWTAWVIPTHHCVETTQIMHLVKAVSKEDAGNIAEMREVRKHGQSIDFVAIDVHLSSGEDFQRYKKGNRYESYIVSYNETLNREL